MKTCSKCKQNKHLTEFTKSTRKVAYLEKGVGYHAYCKKCNAYLARKRRQKFKNGVNQVGKLCRIPREDRALMSAIRYKFSLAKERTRKKNLPTINVDETYLYKLMIRQDKKCKYTGLPFVLETGHELSPSLDRILPIKGYVSGNLQWVCWAANRAKGTMSEIDFVTMCQRVVDKKFI